MPFNLFSVDNPSPESPSVKYEGMLQVVYLNPGTYNLASGIDFDNHSNVTLRGAGPDQTKLVFAKSMNCSGMGGNICIRNSKNDINWGGGPSNLANWTAGYAKDTTQITLDSTKGLS